jgi:hypothetical protein
MKWCSLSFTLVWLYTVNVGLVVYKVRFYLRVYFNSFNARAMDVVFIVQILGIFIDLSRKKPSKKEMKNTT